MNVSSRQPICDYCRLPLPTGWWEPAVPAPQEEQPLYCCLGCQVAAAIIGEKGAHELPRSMLTRLGLSIFFTMNVMAFTMALWTTDVYGGAESSHTLVPALTGLFRYLILLLSLPVLFSLGWPLFENTLKALQRGVLSTDWLLASGVAGSFVFSFLSVFRGQGPIYFEVGCAILVMTTLGRWLEATGKLKAGAALDVLDKLLPDHVRRLADGREQIVPRDTIQPNDLLRVVAGERFPADGLIVANRSFVDEQILTGESRAVLKEPGDRVVGGTFNLDGDLTIAVTEIGASSTLARIVELVRHARESRGRYQRLADRIARRFVPAVSTVALVAFGAHWALGSFERGLWAGLAVALIACPCALGLAAPLAVWSAIGNAAGRGVLFRSGEALERLAEITVVRLDKTGTLTTAYMRVARFLPEDADMEHLVLAHATALSSSSSHAISNAIRDFACRHQVEASHDITDARLVPGMGVIGTFSRTRDQILLGSRRFLHEHGLEIGRSVASALDDAETSGLQMTLVGWGDCVRGLFLFEEQWRPHCVSMIQWLIHSGFDLGVLTGDHAARGRLIAQQLGVPVHAELLPEQKVALIQQARTTLGPVCMIGDGVNDAPALAASDVGIALGCGADVSREFASICLLGDDLSRIPWSIELARRTRRVIRWNLFWAFGYNSAGVLCAALGYLNPVLAAFLMVASSAVVTFSSSSLGRPFEVALGEADLLPVALPSDSSTSEQPLRWTSRNNSLSTKSQTLAMGTSAR